MIEEVKEEVCLPGHFVSYCRMVRGAKLGEFPTCQARPNRLMAGACHNLNFVSIFLELGMRRNFLSDPSLIIAKYLTSLYFCVLWVLGILMI